MFNVIYFYIILHTFSSLLIHLTPSHTLANFLILSESTGYIQIQEKVMICHQGNKMISHLIMSIN